MVVAAAAVIVVVVVVVSRSRSRLLLLTQPSLAEISPSRAGSPKVACRVFGIFDARFFTGVVLYLSANQQHKNVDNS